MSMPGDQCILIVVMLLVSMKVQLVHLLLNVRHVAYAVEVFLALHLRLKIALVLHH